MDPVSTFHYLSWPTAELGAFLSPMMGAQLLIKLYALKHLVLALDLALTHGLFPETYVGRGYPLPERKQSQ